MPDLFGHIPAVYPLYFFYGAAFLVLGTAIAVKNTKASDLKIADSLWLLGLFGFIHGLHEWIVLYPLLQGEQMTTHGVFIVRAITAGTLVLSYLFLLRFGMNMINAVLVRRAGLPGKLMAVLTVLYALVLWRRGFALDFQFLAHAETSARYLLGFTGALATAVGLMTYARDIRHLSSSASGKLFSAGASFALYAVFAGFFPSHFTLPVLPVPIEVLRGLTAVFITYFIIGALNIFDIETRRKIEQQMRLIVQTEKLSSLGRLAAGIAHEINNPLTNASLGIQTLKQRLGAKEPGSDVTEKLDAVERNIDRAAVIARELLQFSRCRESDIMPVDLNSVIESALTLMHYKMKGCLFRKDLGALPPVQGDPVKLEQVIINVLSNACEAMPGGGEIAIHTTRKRDRVRVVISDEGIGLREEHLLRVFDPFFTTKQVGAGTGLGLSICYGIVRQHGGTIEVKNRRRKGVVVTINLPMGRENEKNPDR